MNEPEGFTLRIPFSNSNAHVVHGLDAPIGFRLGPLNGTLELKAEHIVITFEHLPSEESAAKLAARIWASLSWIMLDLEMPFVMKRQFARIQLVKDPVAAAANFERIYGLRGDRLDTIVMADEPSIISSRLRVRTMAIGRASGIVGRPVEIIVEALSEGFERTKTCDIVSSPRLQTALDLFAAHFFETSANAMFLTLVMILDCLSPHIAKHDAVRKMLDEWCGVVSEKKVVAGEGTDEFVAWESLERELLFRKEASLRFQVRSLVLTSLERAGDPDASLVAKRAVQIYDARSTLVHDGCLGSADIHTLVDDARDIAERVLKSILEHGADR